MWALTAATQRGVGMRAVGRPAVVPPAPTPPLRSVVATAQRSAAQRSDSRVAHMNTKTVRFHIPLACSSVVRFPTASDSALTCALTTSRLHLQSSAGFVTNG